MKPTKTNDKSFTLHPLVVALAIASGAVAAAPGELSNSPLFLTNTVQPNILFVVDDSGSMDWEVLLTAGARIAHPNADDSYATPAGDWNEFDYTPDGRGAQRRLCWGYNAMHYNPNRTYTPWKGKDSADVTFANASVSAARLDANDANSGTRDLRSHYFFVWNDSNNDGVYQAGECPTHPSEEANTVAECRAFGTSVCRVVEDLTDAQQTNYANWFSYYRKREYVAKRAISELVTNSTSRMGLTTLHNNNEVRTLIADVDDITTPVDPTARTNKQTLLNKVFDIDSTGGTPLRQALKAAGEYYANGNGWGSSPILPVADGGACQQNFSVLMSDGYWNGGSPGVGHQDNLESSFSGGSHADDYENTLADVAMKYYKEDLSELPNNVPVTSVDPQNLAGNKMHQHMVTFTAAFGINGTLTGNPPNRTDDFVWPEPVADTATAVDDMRHAAWNGRGDFLSANDPQALINGLDAALAAISGRTASAASVAFNSGSLSANSRVYLALFNSEKWSGDLHSYALNPETGVVNSTTTWKAGVTLKQRDLATSPRTILTWNGTDGAAFQWANLTTNQKNDFRTNSTGGTDNEATGLARFHYVRGDRVCEQSYTGTSAAVGASSVASCSYTADSATFSSKNFRNRDGRLGDIVHSAPVYVGKPSYGWPDTLSGTTPYSTFKLNNENRTGVIYVGANDGMLHGFRESNGSEILAYVPGSTYSTTAGVGLHALSNPTYSHRFYVDLTPSVVDAFVKTTSAGTAGWKSILVGGLRAGGRGLFALDVTSPDSFNETGTVPADKVMWEFTGANDADLGYTFSQVAIVPMNNNKWAAIFGNGYNDSGTGQAALFILFIEEGLDGTWSATDYKKISTGVGDTTDRNGLASPAVIDVNGDYKADRIYAGDLRGNMWVFDVASNNSGNWGLAYSSGNGNNAVGVPLFTTAANQPITSRPTIVRNKAIPTSVANTPNVLVLFGTGQYLVSNDNDTTYDQAFYGIWDHGVSQLDTGDLVQQTIGTGQTSGGVSGRTLTSLPVDYGAGLDGWYMNLPDDGERVVTHAVARGDNVYFSTMIPDSDPCTFGGTSWLMVADTQTGGAPKEAAFDLNNDGVVNDLDEINNKGAAGERKNGLASAPVNLGDTRYTSTTETNDGDSIEQDKIEDIAGNRTGRLSWEELIRQ